MENLTAKQYIEAARRLHEVEGEVEIDKLEAFSCQQLVFMM
jgi:hypothetical protein